MKNIIILLILLPLLSMASNNNQASKVVVGDYVPDVPLTKIVSYDGNTRSAKLSDYKNDLLILDFMNTSCSSCIEGLIKKDHLQKEFGDRIHILAVVGGEGYLKGTLQRENETFIRKYLTNKKGYLSKHNVQIPWVVENSLLNQYFPHKVVSHLVWIYKGKLVAITEQDYVSRENIQYILDGNKNEWPLKDDFLPAMDLTVPMVYQDRSKFQSRLKRYSVVSGLFQDGVFVKSGVVRDSINDFRRDYIINLPIINAYLSKYLIVNENSNLVEPSHIILEVNDPSKYLRKENAADYNYEYRKRTYICYEGLTPDTLQTEKQAAERVINDLDNLLGLHGRFEKRKMKCLALYRIDNLKNITSKNNNHENLSEMDTPEIHIKNDELSSLVWKMNQFYGNPPVFDETGFTGKVNMSFSLKSWKDISALQEILKGYGLNLKQVDREVEVFVLTENTFNNRDR
ncbi:DUF3738 domain-containing protein [Pedobacter antarcticus]|uniref:TlpA family protein disulfide reductase n=1 Tax=Pedobacter antarcticus TaxID=34086 RepID=UPI00292DD1FA|nr:DUF3738 domain-containing protein [Pedobacter antarcticus]